MIATAFVLGVVVGVLTTFAVAAVMVDCATPFRACPLAR